MSNDQSQAVECRGCCQVTASAGACAECLGRGWMSEGGWFRKRRPCTRCGGTGICPGCRGTGWVMLPSGGDEPGQHKGKRTRHDE
jgi:hypothetical protein